MAEETTEEEFEQAEAGLRRIQAEMPGKEIKGG